MQLSPSSGEADVSESTADEELEPETRTSDVQALLKLLDEKRTEMAGAVESASELRRQLDRKEADYEALRTKLASQLVATAPTAESGGRASNLQQLFRETKSALERERKSHQLQATNASVRIAHLERELGTQRNTGKKRPASNFGYELRTYRWRATLAVLLLTALSVFLSFFWRNNIYIMEALKVWSPPSRAAGSSSPATAHAQISKLIPNPGTKSALAPSTSTTGDHTDGTDRDQDFPAALSRLDRELGAFPGRVEQVLEAVNATSRNAGIPPCDFEWKQGEAALRFRGTSKGLSLMSSVNDCSNAIARFREEATRKSKDE